MPSAQTETQIRNRLATHDVRYTTGRRAVVAALARTEGPRSAAELHDDLDRAVPLSSLYRSLAVMSDAGVLAPHFGAKGVTRYELAEWIMGHHHHLVCSHCGAVDDVELPTELEKTLEELIGAAAQHGGFRASGHALEIDGLCGACA
jgi:Fur family ferric uptake transcriptional regulator